jgi:hypothetical protein
MRHLHITFERHEQVVYMHEDHCGDDEWVGLEVAPSPPGERVDAVQVSLFAPELGGSFPVVTDGVTESNWEVVVVDASQVTVVQLANMPENTFQLWINSGSSISFGRPRLGVGDSTIVDPHLSGDFAAGGELTQTPGSLIIEYGCEATGFSTLRLTLPFDDPAIPDASWMWSVDCREGVLDVVDDDSCTLANDGHCDEPYECDLGTDTMDCSQEGFENGNSQYCQYAGDGECDEIQYCPAGSDTVDCCLDGEPRTADQHGTPVVAADVCCGGDCVPPGPDWCQYANDGACDEPPIGYECPRGTDTTDCDAAAELPCQYSDDGDCDEGPEAQFCLPGTDFNDCCDAVGQVKVWSATYSDGTDRPDAGRVVAGNADCSEAAASRAGTAFDISVHGDDGNSCTWANDRV